MTTLQPRPPYTDDELATLYPKNLVLEQVQILLRHGERTPISARFTNTGLATYWPYCAAAANFRDAVLSTDGKSWDTLHWRRRLETFGPGDGPALATGPDSNTDAVCQPGELTDVGRQTTLALGQRIRRLYVDQLGFLPAILSTSSTVYLRSTPIQRALESVQQAFVGLYPPSTRAPDLLPPAIVTRAHKDETLFPNEAGCQRFAELAGAFAQRAAARWNESPEMAHLNARIGKYMPSDSPIVRVDSHPRLSGIMDSINATRAHSAKTRLPKEFYEPRVVAAVDRICMEEWFAGYQESREYRTLGVGPMLGDVTQRMVKRAITGGGDNHEQELKSDNDENFRLSLAGCHDTTLAGSLVALGAMDATRDPWPNFSASVAFELFRQETSPATATPVPTTIAPKRASWWSSLFGSPAPQPPPTRQPVSSLPSAVLDGYFVRLRYNDVPLALPACAAPGSHLPGDATFCTLAAFKTAVDSFTPRNWKEACRSNLGKSAFPPDGEVEKPPGL
ncbi:hypothetical protein M433DRAFT_72880 [Acidomyces richmondensis BFW]|nr:MAG: hypothetical protein FE78DRAFT_156320 [Acidomyces sp. 'richmondensis']KYG42875.1 hypothetical protein M433DRAFT_72880 [Acidomyces richmondensis BFW]